MSALLLRPFAYLSISHGSSRLPWLNWWMPFGVSAAIVGVVAGLAPTANLFHSSGLLDKLLGWVQNMPGFYLAALAAVATFAKSDLDNLMPGTPPRVKIVYNGQLDEVSLTRRRFLTMMFAYLTALSLAITLLAVAALTFVDPLRAALSPRWVEPLRMLGAFAFLAFTAQMVSITMWGLYYLGERMHTPDK